VPPCADSRDGGRDEIDVSARVLEPRLRTSQRGDRLAEKLLTVVAAGHQSENL